jgi:hypothetical protein
VPEGPMWEGTNLAAQLDYVVTQVEEATTAAQAASVAAVQAAQAAMTASEKLDNIGAGAIDLDALSAKVADLMDARSRDDDPATGPRT